MSAQQSGQQLKIDTYIWTFEGADAMRFLNGISTVHFTRPDLKGKSFCGRGLLLDPKGKLLAPFIFKCHSESKVELRLDLFDQVEQINQSLFEQTESVIIADKVELRKIKAKAYRVFSLKRHVESFSPFNDRAEDVLNPLVEIKANDGIPLSFLGNDCFELWNESPGLEEAKEDYVEEIEFENSYLRFPQELKQGDLPIEFCLKDAISFFKGCYRGQETVSIATFRGKLSKSLCLLTSNDTFENGEAILSSDDSPAGEVRKVCGNRALALMRFNFESPLKHSTKGEVELSERLIEEKNAKFR